ncbi:cupin domain-containing protein [bacterium]|nr:MAG: cupin domain-containing protein [bacterium]
MERRGARVDVVEQHLKIRRLGLVHGGAAFRRRRVPACKKRTVGGMGDEARKYWLRLEEVPEAGTDPGADKAGNGRWRDLSAVLETQAYDAEVHTAWPGQLTSRYHRHSQRQEFYTVLAGRGHMLLGQERHPVRAGDCIYVPPGISHTLHNTSELPLSALIFGTRETDDACEYPAAPAAPAEPPKRNTLIASIDDVREANTRFAGHPWGPRYVRPLGQALGVRGFEVDVQDVAPGAYNASHHRHAVLEELFFVLSGNVTVLDEGAEAALDRWCVYYAPPGRLHTIRNTGAKDVRLLIFSNPQPPGESVTYYDLQGNEIPRPQAPAS